MATEPKTNASTKSGKRVNTSCSCLLTSSAVVRIIASRSDSFQRSVLQTQANFKLSAV